MGASLSALALASADPAAAQTAAPAVPAAAPPRAPPPPRPATKRPAHRQPSPSANSDAAEDAADAAAPSRDTTVSEITVTARKAPPQYGAVVGDIKPELQLGPSDIQSFGVSTVTELLSELSPETRSDRGRSSEAPVILLNGRRISSLNEVQNIPVEAILRVDILPEEVSLKYGYTADQRVVNIVLRRRFHATTLEGQGGGPTEGGEVSGQAEADLIHIRRDDRLNLDLKYQGNSAISDAARGIQEPAPAQPYALGGNVVSPSGGALAPGLASVAGIPPGLSGAPALAAFAPTSGVPYTTDVAPDRTLKAESQTITANAVLTHPLPDGFLGTINATLSANQSDALQGLSGLRLGVPAGDPFSPFPGSVEVDRYAPEPLHQYVTGWTAHLGGTLNKDVRSWRLSFTSALDHADTQTDTDVGPDASALQSRIDAGVLNPFAPLPASLGMLPQTYARSITDSANAQALANGPLFKEPAGDVFLSAKAGDSQSWQSSFAVRGGSAQAVYLTRNDLNAQISMDVPLASREAHVLGIVGDLSLNGNVTLDQLSDYGRLLASGYGVNWTPIPGWNLIVSHTNDQQAPTVQQLGGPVVSTPNVPVFDYVTGQSIDVTQLSGGSRVLKADNRNVLKIGLTVRPFAKENLTVTANYIKSDIENPFEAFPAVTAAIESAFPGRFVRDAAGALTEFDDRPVNFARSEKTELRWGFNWWRPIGPQPRPRAGFDRAAFLAARARPPGVAPPASAGNSAGSVAPPGAGSSGQAAASGQSGGDSPPRPAPQAGSGASPAAFGGRGFGGGRGGRSFGYSLDRPSPGRLQVAVYHTIYFKDQLLVATGGPTLDLLQGAPASSTGGQYRNEVEGQLGFTLRGYGARLSADWKSATFVNGEGSATGNLYFSGLTTLNLRLFDNLGQQPGMLRRYPLLKGVRVSIYVSNLLDQRISVRDAMGVTPLSYQPGYIDPVGRAITLSLRKLFY